MKRNPNNPARIQSNPFAPDAPHHIISSQTPPDHPSHLLPVHFDPCNRLHYCYSYSDCKFLLENPAALIPPIRDLGLPQKLIDLKHQLVRLSNPPQHASLKSTISHLFRQHTKPNFNELIESILPMDPGPYTIDWVAFAKTLPSAWLLKAFQFQEQDSTFIIRYIPQLQKLMQPAPPDGLDNDTAECIEEIATRIDNHFKGPSAYVAAMISLCIQSYDAGRGLLSNALLNYLRLRDVQIAVSSITPTPIHIPQITVLPNPVTAAPAHPLHPSAITAAPAVTSNLSPSAAAATANLPNSATSAATSNLPSAARSAVTSNLSPSAAVATANLPSAATFAASSLHSLSSSTLIPFVTEVCRFDGPVLNTRRIAGADIVLPSGHHLPKDHLAILVLAAANRDEIQFKNANTFDPSRPNNHELLSFGTGPHACLAARSVIGLTAATLTWCTQRYKKIHLLAEPTEYEPLPNLRLPKDIFVTFE